MYNQDDWKLIDKEHMATEAIELATETQSYKHHFNSDMMQVNDADLELSYKHRD